MDPDELFNQTRHASSTIITAKMMKLPKNFAQKALDLETEIEMGQASIEQVNALIALYSDAVQYFNSLADKKYLYYESKLQNLLVKPEIMMLMSNAERNIKPTEEQYQLLKV